MIEINGVDISTPKTFDITISEIEGESNRNANGDILKDRIAVKRKLNLEWGQLKQNEISKILSLVSEVFFTVRYIDPKEGRISKVFYVSDRSSPVYNYKNDEVIWSGLKMSFIEK